MTFNGVENLFLAEAIRTLKPRYEAVYGPRQDFYLSRGGVRFMLIGEGQDKGKLTVAKSIDGKFVPDPSVEPADCYNLLKPEEGISAAVQRVLEERRKLNVSHEQHASSIQT